MNTIEQNLNRNEEIFFDQRIQTRIIAHESKSGNLSFFIIAEDGNSKWIDCNSQNKNIKILLEQAKKYFDEASEHPFLPPSETPYHVIDVLKGHPTVFYLVQAEGSNDVYLVKWDDLINIDPKICIELLTQPQFPSIRT